MKNIILIASLVFWAGPSLAGIDVSNPAPEVGEKLTLTFDAEVDTLTVVYRPNAAVAETEVIPITPAANTVAWTPKNAGVVALSYSNEGNTVSKNISVRFEGVSYPGIIVMILAGLILFGGAISAFRTLFRDKEEDGTMDFDPDHLPDT